MSWYKRLIEKVKSYYAKRAKEQEDTRTARTKQIEDGLRQAGVDEVTIKRLRGTK